MYSRRFSFNNLSTAALILATVTLSGCHTHGALGAANDITTSATPAVEDAAATTTTAAGATATATGAALSSVSGVVNTMGDSIAAAEMAGIDSGVMNGLGGAVQQTGSIVDSLGQVTGSSLGQIGQPEANVVALQMTSAPLVVQGVGGAVSSVGDAVAAIDNGQMAVLSPVTNPAGALLNQTGAGIASLSSNMNDVMAIPVVQQVTRGGSTMIHMIAIDVEATTQSLGASTGLGVPVNNLLIGTGLTIQNVGGGISTTFAASPLLVSTGDVANSTGTLVASLGGLVNAPTSSNTTTSPSSLLMTVTTQTTVSNVIASLSNAPAPSTTTIPLTGALITVNAPTTINVLRNLPSVLIK